MSMDVDEKSLEAAAAAVHACTFAIWENREEAAQHAAQRHAAERGVDHDRQLKAGWTQHVEAFRSRGPVIWRLCEAPGERRRRHWVLSPAVMESQATEEEAHAAALRGDVIVLPGDSPERIAQKMEAARQRRAASPSAA